MRLLLDTHLLLWTAAKSQQLPAAAATLIVAPENEVAFSVVNLWEIAIKNALGRHDFAVDVPALRDALLANGYRELPVLANHVCQLAALPPLHRDPFDRMLVAQARAEDMLLLTVDRALASYGPAVRQL